MTARDAPRGMHLVTSAVSNFPNISKMASVCLPEPYLQMSYKYNHGVTPYNFHSYQITLYAHTIYISPLLFYPAFDIYSFPNVYCNKVTNMKIKLPGLIFPQGVLASPNYYDKTLK